MQGEAEMHIQRLGSGSQSRAEYRPLWSQANSLRAPTHLATPHTNSDLDSGSDAGPDLEFNPVSVSPVSLSRL